MEKKFIRIHFSVQLFLPLLKNTILFLKNELNMLMAYEKTNHFCSLFVGNGGEVTN